MSDSAQLIVAPFPPPLGGVSVAAVNVAAVLEGQGIAVLRFSTGAGTRHEDLYARKGWRHVLRTLALFGALLCLLVRGPKVRIAHVFCVSNSAFLRDFVFLLLLRLAGKRVIVHLHSKTAGELFVRPRWAPWFGRMLSVAQHVIVLSEFHRAFFSAHIDPAKLRVMENFVFSGPFHGGAHEGDFLFVGRLSRLKGFFDLVEAVALLTRSGRHPGLRIDCLGEAENTAEMETLRDLMAAQGVARHFRLHGNVSGEPKYTFFRHARCLVFPSHFENSSVVLKEAIAARLPVIASDIDANCRILDPAGAALYCKAATPADLAATMERFLDDPASAATLMRKLERAIIFDEHYAYACMAGLFD
ncbi:MAG: glycosyltransferase family 4 protein [Pseudomonadota bacterium]